MKTEIESEEAAYLSSQKNYEELPPLDPSKLPDPLKQAVARLQWRNL
jgi:hypothetical protein